MIISQFKTSSFKVPRRHRFIGMPDSHYHRHYFSEHIEMLALKGLEVLPVNAGYGLRIFKNLNKAPNLCNQHLEQDTP